MAGASFLSIHRLFLSVTMIFSCLRLSNSFRSSAGLVYSRRVPHPFASSACRPLALSSASSSPDTESSSSEQQSVDVTIESPWGGSRVHERGLARKRNSNRRFRQHVNPLARKYQTPAALSHDWPASSYADMSKPLHLDIGCGKGGFLLNMTDSDMSYNYLGLEIRPLVAQFARERIAIYGYTGHLDYVGCNANVDLDRTLSRYQQAVPNRESLALQRVSIQFPDPHFKTAHAKRRLVTQELVSWLAAFMPPQATVFLQSDIKEVLDDMRMRFREYPVYFQDTLEDTAAYLPQNVLGVPTEREVSVLGKELPVYRALFTRTAEDYAQNKEASLPLS